MNNIRYYIGRLFSKIDDWRDERYLSRKIGNEEEEEKRLFIYSYYINPELAAFLRRFASQEAVREINKKNLNKNCTPYYYYKIYYIEIIKYTFKDFMSFISSFFMIY